MEKTAFTYQRWFMKIGCAGIGLPVVFIIQCLLAELFEIENADFWYILLCALVMLAWLFIYYKFMQRHNWFERTGFYWIKNSIVYIQKQNKIYELKNVSWLRGTTVSVYGMAKAGMLVVQTEKEKLVLVSSGAHSVDSFANCDLLPLFETVLAYNSQLTKDDDFEYWYDNGKADEL